MAAKAMLTLIWPGAAGILQSINKSIWPPALQKIIGHSRFKAQTDDYHSMLLQQFGQQTGSDLPLAALRFPGETALCADLCYLHADRDCLRLFHRDITLSDDEALQLQHSLRPLLDEFNGEWLTFSARHWGLKLPALPEMQWQAIDALEGQSVNEKLPVGSEQNHWRRLLNEIQMSLFEHPVNQRREAEGLLPVNAVWFSGAAALNLNNHWQIVAGDDDLLQPLAKQANIDWQADVSTLLANKITDAALGVLPVFDPSADWQQQLQSLEAQIFQPVWQRLRRWQLNQFELCVPGYGVYQLSRWRSWL